MVNVLITGAEGFAGRVLAEGLRARGDEVRALVAKGAPPAVRARFERAGIEVHEARRDDEEAIVVAAQGVGAIVHVAPDQRLRGTIAHEIETHIFTTENGLRQPYRIFSYGFANFLFIQEGLADAIKQRLAAATLFD